MTSPSFTTQISPRGLPRSRCKWVQPVETRIATPHAIEQAGLDVECLGNGLDPVGAQTNLRRFVAADRLARDPDSRPQLPLTPAPSLSNGPHSVRNRQDLPSRLGHARPSF